MFMGDTSFQPVQELKCQDMLSVGDGSTGTKDCNSCHRKPAPKKVMKDKGPQFSAPIYPFGMVGSVDLSKFIIFTNVPQGSYPGSPGQDSPERKKEAFLKVCTDIKSNEGGIARNPSNKVTMADVQKAYALCCALYKSATGEACPTTR
jgi:hypothetical protein